MFDVSDHCSASVQAPSLFFHYNSHSTKKHAWTSKGMLKDTVHLMTRIYCKLFIDISASLVQIHLVQIYHKSKCLHDIKTFVYIINEHKIGQFMSTGLKLTKAASLLLSLGLMGDKDPPCLSSDEVPAICTHTVTHSSSTAVLTFYATPSTCW